MAKFIGSDFPNNYNYLRTVVIILLGDKKIRDNAEQNLKDLERFGIDTKRIYSLIGAFKKEYTKISELSHLINELKYDQSKTIQEVVSVLDRKIKESMETIPAINDALLLLFFALVRGTVLENVQIPKEEIMIAEGKLSPKYVWRYQHTLQPYSEYPPLK